jgi:hypothetical protein
MADFWRFVMAVGRHWLVLLGGGAAIIVILGVVERLTGTNLTARWYAALLVALFFYAAFLAWRDEQRRAVVLERQVDDEYPKWEVSIQQITIGTLQGKVDPGAEMQLLAYVAPVVSVLNLGASSVMKGVSLVVKHPSGGIHRGR